MIKAIIVDDEAPAGELIASLVKIYPEDIDICALCTNVSDAVEQIRRYQPDILFLDIELADGSGFDILEQVPDLSARILFVTAYEDYSVKAIKHRAFDYILKPIDLKEFNIALSNAIKDLRKSSHAVQNTAQELVLPHRKIAIPDRTGYKYFDVDEIILLEAMGSYTKVYLTNDRTLTTSKGLKEFQLVLPVKDFLRVHKSYLVQLAHITALRKDDGCHLQMSNHKSIPIGAKNKDEVLKQLQVASYSV